MMFSVVLCNYNYEDFICRAIESVLAQSFQDFELIIVDDGSTDSSRLLINRFTDSRIKKIFQANMGQGAAFKAGITRASGDYIALLDSDDEWLPAKLEECATVLAAHPEISFLIHNMMVIDRYGYSIGDLTSPVRGFYDPIPAYRKLEHHSLPYLPTTAIVASSSILRKVRFNADEWRIDADTPIIAGLSVLGTTYMLSQNLACYRKHGGNATAQLNWINLIDRWSRFYDCVNEHLKSSGSDEKFDFSRSYDYIASRVVKSKPRSFSGIRARIDFLMIKLALFFRGTISTHSS
jgi:glycosyltransferase involved in cell wall biosynthesis